MPNNTIWDKRACSQEWAIYPEGNDIYQGEVPISYGAIPSPSIELDTKDPRVGRIAFWGGGAYRAIVRAVVNVNGTPETLLLEDWTGYPWVRVPLDARLQEQP